jgi:hypothetical protein
LAKAQMPPGIDEWLKTGEVDIALAQSEQLRSNRVPIAQGPHEHT